MVQPRSSQNTQNYNRAQATYSRANARLRAIRERDRRRRRNRIIAVVAVLVVVAVGVFAGKTLMDNGVLANFGFGTSSTTAASPGAGREGSSSDGASQDAAEPDADESSEDESSEQSASLWDEGLSESSESSEASEPSEPSQEESSESAAAEPASQSTIDLDNDPRAAEFALDPDRTDWNYEGNGRKVVYLTFDDGPSDKTQAFLDVLDKYGCKATFFVTAAQPEYAYMIREAYSRGHTIGMHTASHDYAYVYSSVEAYYADLDAIAAVVEEQIGYVPCFIRFPGGSSNVVSADYTEGIMSYLTVDVVENGYQYYDWNASSGDGATPTVEEIVEYACSFDQYDNIILLMHDSTTKENTLEALPQVIEYYQALGYTFEAIDRDSIVVHHGVSN